MSSCGHREKDKIKFASEVVEVIEEEEEEARALEGEDKVK